MAARVLSFLALTSMLLLAGALRAGEPADLNRATASDLQRVKGIGPKTAANIVAFRERRGGLKRLAELLEVNRIGPKTLAKIACHFQVPGEGPQPCGEQAPAGSQKARTPVPAGRVNLNLADAEALTRLPGIGPKKAAMIIAHRDRNGPFDSVDDLGDIKGFGPKTIARLAPHVVVRLRVNDATGEQLTAMGFVNAQRILEYRKIVGRFQGIEDLEQIPGIDRKFLDLVEELLSFE